MTTKSKDALAAFVAARDLTDLSKGVEAEPLFKKAVTLDPEFVQARTYLLGYLSPSDVAAEAEKLAALAKTLPEPERVFVEMNLDNVRGDDNAKMAAEKRLGELVPDDWRVQTMLAGRASFDHKYDDAVVHLKRAIELAPKVGGSTWGSLGYVYLAQHKTDDCVAAFKKWAENTPTDPNAYDSLGDAQRKSGKYADAEASFKKALEVDPKFVVAYTGLAFSRAERGDVAGGVDAIQKFVDNQPRELDKPGAIVMLAYWQSVAGKHDDAEKSFAAAEKLMLAQKRASTYAFAALDRAEVAVLVQEKPKDALKLVDEAAARMAKAEHVTGGEQLAFQSWSASARTSAYSVLADKEATKKSEAELEAVIAKFPDNSVRQSQRHDGRGDVALANGNAKGALAEFRQCEFDTPWCLAKGIAIATKLGDKATADELRTRLADNLSRDTDTLIAKWSAKMLAAK